MRMIEKDELYPLLFDPIYVEVVWGGNMLRTHFRRQLPQTSVPIGESWEICDRKDAESVVSNGSLKGYTLHKLLQYYEKALAGDLYSGGRFPLLVKFIDAGKRLSLQVHPDEMACRGIQNAEPKTEMWYVVAAKPGSRIFAGLKSSCTQRRFMENIKSTEIENCLQSYNSIPGDAYFIRAGIVHSIGSGNLLLEIQQNGDTTYRVSDWSRLDFDGEPRELHIENALKCINFTDRTSPRISGVSDSVEHNRKYPIINRCPFFRVEELRLVENFIDKTDKKSFHLLTAINNSILVKKDEISVKVKRGCTCLIPAICGPYSINLVEEKETTVIRTTL